MPLRLRRGTDAERQSITPILGELIYVTDTKEIYVGDGSTQGGNLFNTSLSYDTTPSLSGNLDLNGKNIVGTGNINIDGTISATGSINLGDGAEDNIIVGGQISSSLIPDADSSYDFGSPSAKWNNGFFQGLNVDGLTTVDSIKTSTIYSDDSSILYDAASGILSVPTINGDLVGNVFGTDSTVLVDTTNNSLSNGIITISNESIETLSGETITINTGLNIQSNAQADKEGFTISGTGDGTTTESIVRFETSDTSVLNPSQIQNNTVLSSVQTSAYNGTSYEVAAINAVISSDIADPSYASIPSRLVWFVGNGTDAITTTPPASFDSKGVFNAPIIQPSSYVDSNFPTSPNEGWIIFDTTNKQFKGWNGTAWITLG